MILYFYGNKIQCMCFVSLALNNFLLQFIKWYISIVYSHFWLTYYVFSVFIQCFHPFYCQRALVIFSVWVYYIQCYGYSEYIYLVHIYSLRWLVHHCLIKLYIDWTVLFALSNTVTSSHMWLMSILNVAGESGRLNFLFYFIPLKLSLYLNRHVSSGYHWIAQMCLTIMLALVITRVERWNNYFWLL